VPGMKPINDAHVAEPGLAEVEVRPPPTRPPSPSRNCSPPGGQPLWRTARFASRASQAYGCAATWPAAGGLPGLTRDAAVTASPLSGERGGGALRGQPRQRNSLRRGLPGSRSCSGSGSGDVAAWRRTPSAAASLRATSSAWQVPHTDRSPAFQAVRCMVVSSQRWSVNFPPHRLHTGRRASRSATRRRSSSARGPPLPRGRRGRHLRRAASLPQGMSRAREDAAGVRRS
jgi:hypothetical protein